MQRKAKDLFLEIDDNHKYDHNLLKDLGVFFFKELNQEVKRPKNLIINIKGLGRFYPRNLRMRKRFSSDFQFYIKKYGDNIKRKEYFEEEIKFWQENIYPLYDSYVLKKKEVKSKKNEYYKKMDIIRKEKETESTPETC